MEASALSRRRHDPPLYLCRLPYPGHAGFLSTSVRIIRGLGFGEPAARLYDIVADYAATIVFLAVSIAAARRVIFKPARYAVPPKYGKGHAADAIFLLGLIAHSDVLGEPV